MFTYRGKHLKCDSEKFFHTGTQFFFPLHPPKFHRQTRIRKKQRSFFFLGGGCFFFQTSNVFLQANALAEVTSGSVDENISLSDNTMNFISHLCSTITAVLFNSEKQKIAKGIRSITPETNLWPEGCRHSLRQLVDTREKLAPSFQTMVNSLGRIPLLAEGWLRRGRNPPSRSLPKMSGCPYQTHGCNTKQRSNECHSSLLQEAWSQ